MSTERAPDEAPLPDLPRPAPLPPTSGLFEQLAEPLPHRIEPKINVPEGHELVTETAAQREARRNQHMLGESYRPTSATDLTFDPRIAYELALGLNRPAAIFQKYGVTLERGREMLQSPHFIATLRKYKEEVTGSGITFRLKAKMQAEDLLADSYWLAKDPEVPPAVRADMIKWTAKVAGLEPATGGKGEMGGGGGSGFTLQLVFAGTPGQPPLARVIEGEVVKEEGS